MSEIVKHRIDSLIELAESEGDVNTQIILLALRGAKYAGEDGALAAKVQEFLRDVLIPKAKAGIEDAKARDN